MRSQSRVTATLLQSAAFGATGAILLMALSPVTAAAAVANPIVYAAIAAASAIAPMLARQWTGAPGTASLTAGVTAGLTLAFTGLGPLILPALLAPAAAVDVVLWKELRPSAVRSYVAALAAGLVIWAISFTVIAADILSPLLVVTLLGVRLSAYMAAMALARLLAKRLQLAGVRQRNKKQ